MDTTGRANIWLEGGRSHWKKTGGDDHPGTTQGSAQEGNDELPGNRKRSYAQQVGRAHRHHLPGGVQLRENASDRRIGLRFVLRHADLEDVGGLRRQNPVGGRQREHEDAGLDAHVLRPRLDRRRADPAHALARINTEIAIALEGSNT